MSFTITLDAASDARVDPLVTKVQALYDAAGYPVATITFDYVLEAAALVGLHWWVDPTLLGANRPDGTNVPTTAKLTPTVHGVVQYTISPSTEVTLLSAVYAATFSAAQVDVLGCAVCTGLALLSGVVAPAKPAGDAQVGPFLAPV